ncbi:MAG: DNA topoisomerase VI subunit B [archaeon]
MKQSLTGDQPVLIKEKGRIRIVKIGELIDKYIQGEGVYDCFEKDIFSLSFDDAYKYSFRKVSHLIKHGRENEIVHIKTSYGKSIKVTGCHSIFGIDRKTLTVKEIRARDLKKGDLILAPKRVSFEENECQSEINVLDYIDVYEAKKQGWYLYTDKDEIKKIFATAKIVHQKKDNDKSRKHYLLTKNGNTVEVLDDSYKQYVTKGFLPVWLAKFLRMNEGAIRTYFHGKEYAIPVKLQVTNGLAKLLGLFVAEGHVDSRQIGFTFSRTERDLVRLVCEQAFLLGSSHTVEERPEKNCVRVKLFGGLLSHLFRTWCGKGAHNKKVPEFIFTSPTTIRQDFIDYLYIGDGHNTKNRNQLMLTTVSEELANQVVYLWLLQGVVSSITRRISKGLGKTPSKMCVVSVYGLDINVSNYFSTNNTNLRRKRRLTMSATSLANKLGAHITLEEAGYLEKLQLLDWNKDYSYAEMTEFFGTDKPGYKLRYLLDSNHLTQNSSNGYCVTLQLVQRCKAFEQIKKLAMSDFLFLDVKEIEVMHDGYEHVYDLSVPACENFVAGFGGIAAHNSRGQQGIGISAAVMYAQLTTGRPAKITSRTSPSKPAHYYELHINKQTNSPDILKDEEREWKKEHGTKVELDLEANYLKGSQSVDEYLKQTAIINSHITLIYLNPKGEQKVYARATTQLPPEPKEVKPHPHGLEFGMLQNLLKGTESRTLQSFLTNDLSRVGSQTAKDICDNALLDPKMKPGKLMHADVEKLITAIKNAKIMAPSADSISPIGTESIEKGIRKEINAEFYCSVSRPPSVYRGNPFQIEVAIAYGGEQPGDQTANVIRFANRVPLLYQQGACAISKSIMTTNWKAYGLNQSNNQLPVGPLTILVHIASVWVPFTSESKEAIAHYPEIIKEIKLALQEAGRKLQTYVHKKKRVGVELQKRSYIEKYIPAVAESIITLAELKKEEKGKIEEHLKDILERHRGELEDMSFDEDKNAEYKEELAARRTADLDTDDEQKEDD